MDLLDDPADPQLAVFLGLRDHRARQQRERAGGDMADVFVCEGDLVIERAVDAGLVLRSVLVDARRTKPLPQAFDRATILGASPEILTEVTGRPDLRDPLACFIRPAPIDVDELLETASTIAVLEGVNNPNNLGMIMRNAAGLGIDVVLLDPTCGDPLYRRAIRASMGQVFAVPSARLDALPASLDRLHDAGFTSFGLTPTGDLDLADVEPPERTAILLGAEGPGLTSATLESVHHRLRIPMQNDVDSLNVSVAGAIAFHHLVRGR